MKTTSHSSKRSAVATVAALVLTLLLGACSAPSNWAEESVERINSRSENLAKVIDMPSPDRFETYYFEWKDEKRGRLVPAKLYLPKAPSAPDKTGSDKAGLVLFSHGLGGSREGYTYLGKYWAANGFASLHVQHIGSDRQIWVNNPLTLLSRIQAAAQDAEAINRALDLSFALDQLQKLPQIGSRIDTKNVTAAGHSYGANTAMLLAGASVERENGPVKLRDERVQSALLISSPPFYGLQNTAAVVGNIHIPSLHITSTEDEIKIPGYGSGFNDRLNIFKYFASAIKNTPQKVAENIHKTLLVFKGGSHSMFTDRLGTGGEVLNPQVKQATREAALLFLQSVHSASNAKPNANLDFAKLQQAQNFIIERLVVE